MPLFDLKIPRINEVFLVILLLSALFPVTSFTGGASIRNAIFPDGLREVDRDGWVEKRIPRQESIVVTDFFRYIWLMMFNLFMIAVLPRNCGRLDIRGVLPEAILMLFRSGLSANMDDHGNNIQLAAFPVFWIDSRFVWNWYSVILFHGAGHIVGFTRIMHIYK